MTTTLNAPEHTAQRAEPMALAVNGLHVRYGSVEAVRDVSLDVRPGEIFGLLGRNGAGKSTTINALTGLLRPAAGTTRVFGYDPITEGDAVHALLSLQPQQATLFPRITVRETLRTWAALYPDPRDVSQLVEDVALTEQADVRAGKLSGGQEQRLLLATALVGNTPLVVLDEPTNGLDPHARRAVWDVVSRARDEGTTFLLTTHAMAEAEEMCDRIALIHDGRLIAQGTPPELIAEHTVGGVVTVRTQQSRLPEQLEQDWHVSARSLGSRDRWLRFEVATDDPYALARWVQQRDPGADVRPRPAAIEDVFLALTGTTTDLDTSEEEIA